MNTTKVIAEQAGIYSKVRKLIDELNELPYVEIGWDDIDIRDFLECHSVILVPKYTVPVALENYYEVRRRVLDSIVAVAAYHGLTRTEDRIEDYGEHWYIVMGAGKGWRN